MHLIWPLLLISYLFVGEGWSELDNTAPSSRKATAHGLETNYPAKLAN
jgi:hypothetical protein